MSICVYAVAAANPRAVIERAAAAEGLKVVKAGPLAAIVRTGVRQSAATAVNLRKYEAVIRKLDSRLPAILPARFGTCLVDVDEITWVLQGRRLGFLRTLRHVRRRAQMTLRVVQATTRTATLLVAAHPENRSRGRTSRSGSSAPIRRPLASAGPGAAYLHSRVAAAARAREVPGFDPVRQAVSRWVRDERVEVRASISTVYHLVPRSAVVAYRSSAERAATAAGLRIVVTGPWPPYAFADW